MNSKMKLALAFALLLMSFSIVFAAEISYDVTFNGFDANNQSVTLVQSVNQNCETKCTYALPNFAVPENTMFMSYSLSSSSNVYFTSTNAKQSQKQDDSIVAEIPEEAPICSPTKCESKCVKCSDNKCHEPSFVCREQLSIDKIAPKEIDLGQNQINILVKNTGNVDISQISAELSGDGILTTSAIPIQKLVAGDKDYVFIKINTSKSGVIDLVIKIIIDDLVRDKFVDQLTVFEAKNSQPTETYNASALNDQLASLRQTYRTLESNYQEKKAVGYPVDIVYDKLKEVYAILSDAQSKLLSENYKQVQVSINLIQNNMQDIDYQLKNAKQPELTFSDKLKSNLLFFGSIAAAIVSIFTAYKLVQNSIDKEKLKELHRRILLRNNSNMSHKRKKHLEKKEHKNE